MKIQRKLVKQILNKNINLAISWGHAKRTCGMLKTQSDNADLYSISILYLISKVINMLTNISVQLSQHCSMLLKNNGKTEFITNY